MLGLLGVRSQRLPLWLRLAAVEAVAATAEAARTIKAPLLAATAAVPVGPITAVELPAAVMVMMTRMIILTMTLRTILGADGGTHITRKVKKRNSPTLMRKSDLRPVMKPAARPQTQRLFQLSPEECGAGKLLESA